MPSTRSGNEPFDTASLAPSDAEIFPGGWRDLGLQYYAPRGVDDAIVADEIREAIIQALHEVGDHDIAGMLR